MDSEKKPLDLLSENLHELKNDISILRSDISYIKVALIQHIISIDKKKEIEKEEEIKKWNLWFFT